MTNDITEVRFMIFGRGNERSTECEAVLYRNIRRTPRNVCVCMFLKEQQKVRLPVLCSSAYSPHV